MSPSADVLKAQMGFPMQVDGHAVLENHRTQSAVAINGWRSVLFGSPFLAAGIFIEFVALNVVSAKKTAPDWLIGIIGGMFFLAGAFLVVHGLRDLMRKAIWRREAAAHPGEPWVYDYHWHREGISFSAFGDMLQRLVGALIWSVFLVPFAWVANTVRSGGWPFIIGIAFFGFFLALGGLIFWYRWATMFLDFLRYGNSYLYYGTFPFTLGGQLRTRLHPPRNLAALEELTATLRCVQEMYITSGSSDNRSTKVVCYELYKDVLTLGRDRLIGLAGNDIPFEFPLPADGLPTTLASTPPVYWEIEVNGKARGVDYESCFLVPVYRQS